MAEEECQRFFALSKRVPKDVKRYCGICRQHGVMLETRGHTCQFKDCNCTKCELVRTRRRIMSQQIRLRRAQDKRFQRTNEPEQADVMPIKQCENELRTTNPEELLGDAKSMCYFCQKCKNHNILVWKKQHKKQCPFTSCTCEKCELIETRRRLDQHMKKRRAELMKKLKQEQAGVSSDDRSTPVSVGSAASASPKSFRFDSLTPENPPTLLPQPNSISMDESFSLPSTVFSQENAQPLVQYIPVYIPVSTVANSSDSAALLSKLLSNYSLNRDTVDRVFNRDTVENGLNLSTVDNSLNSTVTQGTVDGLKSNDMTVQENLAMLLNSLNNMNNIKMSSTDRLSFSSSNDSMTSVTVDGMASGSPGSTLSTSPSASSSGFMASGSSIMNNMSSPTIMNSIPSPINTMNNMPSTATLMNNIPSSINNMNNMASTPTIINNMPSTPTISTAMTNTIPSTTNILNNMASTALNTPIFGQNDDKLASFNNLVQAGMMSNVNNIQLNCGNVPSLRDIERLLCLQHRNQTV
ncbi:unnamed protein product [Bursaphelenchus okinawaensis]|uniref:DM domain-containing protein n=1 Tax=Bursaphelenchus okinawaensis TaxID=465554 RepID=A0A811L5R3_9BILA|nr:unnamed protein product [Bursaphelenchus okinawaensis]CAG9117210.1 unnamed protein product [Bursaphelenchus okinawaensis]